MKTTQQPDEKWSYFSADELFQNALPISPNKKDGSGWGQNTTKGRAIEKAWEEGYRRGAFNHVLAWSQLAMPNTGTTSMDWYMSHGGNMTPVQRSGGCGDRGCVQRISMPSASDVVPDVVEESIAPAFGVNYSNLRECTPDAFYKMSSVARSVASGGHLDYSRAVETSKDLLRVPSRGPGRLFYVQAKAAILGTTLRDPILYHHKLFEHGTNKFDTAICNVWASSMQYNNSTVTGGEMPPKSGFYCVKAEGAKRGGWSIGSGVEEYMDFAHHRWNLFTRFIAGTILPGHFPIISDENLLQEVRSHYYTRHQAIEQNEMGRNSPDYIAAVAHLEAMPHFSIFERMEESMELLCFTFCYNCKDLGFTYEPHEHPPVSEAVRESIGQFHKLDLMLYEHVNTLFSKRVDWMRRVQANAVHCDILLSGCGLSCAT